MRKKTRNDDWAYDDSPILVGRDVLVPDEESTFTGLYDANGEPLHRQKEPVGFRVR